MARHRLIKRTTSLLAADEVEDTVHWCDIRSQKPLVNRCLRPSLARGSGQCERTVLIVKRRIGNS